MITRFSQLYEKDREILKQIRNNTHHNFFTELERNVKDNTGRFCCDVA